MMKTKTLMLFLAMLLTATAGAQTVNVHRTDGTVVNFPASEISYIDFSVGSEPNQPPAGVVAVDLGLPSGTKWANMNVGAEKPEDCGFYFAWGETVGYTSDTTDGRLFDWPNYKWSGDSEDTLNKYCTDSQFGTVDNKVELDLEDDAAYQNWGSGWRMPSIADIKELMENTNSEWVSVNGVEGRRFTSKNNGNSVFLPIAGVRIGAGLYQNDVNGNYWTCKLHSGTNPQYGCLLYIDSNSAYRNFDTRRHGCSVRPVLRNGQ